MAIPTKLIFGIRTSQATKLVVTGGPASTAVPLLIITRDLPAEASVPCEQGVWTADLPKGDHMVRIEIPNESDWFDDILKFTMSSGSSIVFFGPKATAPEPAIISWSAMEGTTGGGTGSDPKDPWPPPSTATLLTLGDDQWFINTLRKARLNIAILRSAPHGK